MVDWSTIPRVDGGYKTILVDPPWRYEHVLGGTRVRGGAQKHYDTMTVEQIGTIPILELAAPKCMVWLWTTNTHLHASFHVLEAWGVSQKVVATWVKRRFGLGYWLRGKTEHLQLAVVGNPRVKYVGPHGAMGSAWSTLLDEEAPDDAMLVTGKYSGHSVKPRSSYEMIEALGEAPRLELFARLARKGWTGWGDELSP